MSVLLKSLFAAADIFFLKSNNTGGTEMKKYFRQGEFYDISAYLAKHAGMDEYGVRYLVINDRDGFHLQGKPSDGRKGHLWLFRIIEGMNIDYWHDGKKCVVEPELFVQQKFSGLKMLQGVWKAFAHLDELREYSETVEHGSACGETAFRAIVTEMIDSEEEYVPDVYDIPLEAPEKILDSIRKGRTCHICNEELQLTETID